jgi:hypothetical protein
MRVASYFLINVFRGTCYTNGEFYSEVLGTVYFVNLAIVWSSRDRPADSHFLSAKP